MGSKNTARRKPPSARPGPSRAAATPPDRRVPDEFASDVKRVLERLRLAVARLVESSSCAMDRAIDLQRSLGLDAALAWQIHRLTSSHDVMLAGKLIPKAGAMDRFLIAMRDHGGTSKLIAETNAAYAEFESVVADHAGDRETFLAMISALRPDDPAGLIKVRRVAAKANASVWGISVRVAVHAVVFRQRPTGEHDCLALRGRLGVRRLQERAVIGIYASGRTWGGSSCPPEGAPAVTVDSCQLLPQFSSEPLPRVERIQAADGTFRDVMRLEGLGHRHAVNVFWRNVSRNFPGGSVTPPHGMTSPCTEPAEMLIADLLVPRGWTAPSTVQGVIAEHSRTTIDAPDFQAQRLPFEGEAEYLGTNLEAMHSKHVPRYPEIMRSQLHELNWLDTEFDIYRCVVPWPVLHSAVHLSVSGPAHT